MAAATARHRRRRSAEDGVDPAGGERPGVENSDRGGRAGAPPDAGGRGDARGDVRDTRSRVDGLAAKISFSPPNAWGSWALAWSDRDIHPVRTNRGNLGPAAELSPTAKDAPPPPGRGKSG